MSKSHGFSIYLLKEGFGADNSLKDDHRLETAEATHLPQGSILYILDNDPKPPWWRGYFGISKALNQVSKGALVFLPAAGRCFALSFGHVFHHLKDESFEYDFGLRVTLNAVDPNKLKSTDIVEPGSSRRRRTQLPTGSDLTYFDFDRDSTIIKSLVGKIKDEYSGFFGHATGASNIRLSSDVQADRLVSLCEKLLPLYRSDVYKTEFPDIHNIEPIRDPGKVQQLNAELLKALQEKRDELYLTVPEILNHNEGILVSFSGGGESLDYQDLFTKHYYEYLEINGIELMQVTEATLKAHKLNLIDENRQNKGSYRIYDCIAVDIEIQGEDQTYHLCDGSWYKVSNDYVGRLGTFLDPYFEDANLPYYNHPTEGQYNQEVARTDARFICLDTKNISPRGSTSAEPCDLYIVKDGKALFHHVKVSTRSAVLSHLFDQGTNSLELIISEDESRNKLKQLVIDRIGSNDRPAYLKAIDERNFKVVYAIATRKDKTKKSKNLPLFSRINLRRSIKTLTLMRVETSCCFIEDRTEAKPGQQKRRRPRVAAVA